jgi:short-subunit dehydrogenase
MPDEPVVLITGASSGVGQATAGLLSQKGFKVFGTSRIRSQFETNFFGVVRMVSAILPSMRRQRRGRIVNVSSLSGLSPIPFLGIYSATKFALEGYTEALRHEVNPRSEVPTCRRSGQCTANQIPSQHHTRA